MIGEFMEDGRGEIGQQQKHQFPETPDDGFYCALGDLDTIIEAELQGHRVSFQRFS